MADAKTAKLSDLVKFNKNQNPIEAFISNFIRQAKNPTLFGFFKLPPIAMMQSLRQWQT